MLAREVTRLLLKSDLHGMEPYVRKLVDLYFHLCSVHSNVANFDNPNLLKVCSHRIVNLMGPT